MQRDHQDGTVPKTRDISVPEEALTFFKTSAKGE
jgi:hypothetical protein